MSLPARPHDHVDLNCPECIEWARAVVATPTEKKQKRAEFVNGKPEMPLAEFGRSVMALACKATGLSEDELRRRAAEMDLTIPETPMHETLERADRDTVIRRRVPLKHIETIYDADPKMCDALAKVRRCVESPRQTFLVLSGGVGVYKTGSACWALTVKPGRFVFAEELARLAGARDGEDANQWRMTRGTPLLVLDDLGNEYVDDKGWMAKVIRGLFDYRYANRLKTIVTTNLDAKQFMAIYGVPVFDRVREEGEFVDIHGKSNRRRA